MNLLGIELLLLKTLYNARGRAGNIVTLLSEQNIDVSIEQAHALGRKLHRDGYIYHTETKASADATLLTKGVEVVRWRSKDVK